MFLETARHTALSAPTEEIQSHCEDKEEDGEGEKGEKGRNKKKLIFIIDIRDLSICQYMLGDYNNHFTYS